MSNILNRFKTIVGGEAEDYDEDMTSAWTRRDGEADRGYSDREVRVRTTTQLKVVLAQPHSLEEVPAIADDLKSSMTVILNIEGLDREIARRILDTVSGAAYALDAGNTYMILPYNVECEGNLMNELTSSGLLGTGLDF